MNSKLPYIEVEQDPIYPQSVPLMEHGYLPIHRYSLLGRLSNPYIRPQKDRILLYIAVGCIGFILVIFLILLLVLFLTWNWNSPVSVYGYY